MTLLKQALTANKKVVALVGLLALPLLLGLGLLALSVGAGATQRGILTEPTAGITPTVVVGVVVPIPTESALVLSILPAEVAIPTVTAQAHSDSEQTTPSSAIPNEPTSSPEPSLTSTSTSAAAITTSAPSSAGQAQDGSASATGSSGEVPSATATPLPVVEAIPVKLNIGAIKLSNSLIEPVGVEKLKQPDGSTVLRWQARDNGAGYQPDKLGEACNWGLVTLNGHNWWSGKPGVFVNLNKLKAGDKIGVTTDKGVSCEYRVEWSRQYPPQEISWLYELEAVSDPTKTYLNLYTCSTDFKERYVVRASLEKPQG